MKICMQTNIISPHQMPFALAIAERIGTNNFRFAIAGQVHSERLELGWGTVEQKPDWVLDPTSGKVSSDEIEMWKTRADLLISGNRDFDCFSKRMADGRYTFYMSERWFKPPLGMLRLLHPAFLRMACRIWRLLCSPNFYYLPIGVHAAKDMLLMARMFDLCYRLLFRFQLITPAELYSKFLLWGYFVEPSGKEHSCVETLRAERSEAVINKQFAVGHDLTDVQVSSRTNRLLKVLWVGRMLNWKRVDTLIKAVGRLCEEGHKIELTIVGHGPEEASLRKLSNKILTKLSASGVTADLRSATSDRSFQRKSPITFHPPVPIAQVRDLMRQSDVYVLPSDGGEGWGAVVNEAMEEGCAVIATHESGAGATMIKDGQNGLLFRAGDVNALAKSLRRMVDQPDLRLYLAKKGSATLKQLWGPQVAAERLVASSSALLSGQQVPGYSEGPLSEALW